MDTIKILPTADSYRYDIGIRQFQLTADEPVAIGGTDLGPTPTELVFAGLGSCKAITLKMYAARKDWPLESVTTNVEVSQVDKRYKITVFLKPTGNLSIEQKERLLAISNKCPVHKLLAAGADITTPLVSDY